jgi:hypothetical protein
MSENLNTEQTVGYINGAVRTGLIMAAVGIAVFFTTVLLDMPIVAGIVAFVKYGVLIYLLRAGLLAHRAELGGYMSFGRAFIYSFVALLLSSILATIVEGIYMNFINPEYLVQQVEKAAEMMENFGFSNPAMDDAIEQMAEEGAGLRVFSQNMLTRGFSSLAVSLIAALIVKRDKPLIAA